VKRRLPVLALVTAAAGLLGGCSTLGYYGQAVVGELRVLHERRPIPAVIADASTPPPVRRKLERVQAARRFAHVHLGLPKGGSYTTYVALDREYTVWVVYAAPEFSLTPHDWCFPFAGCVPYRGYFHKADAERFAAGLERRGDDVYVTGAPAYSTLGWFADPVYSSMLRWGKVELAGTLFHELAHQKLYVEGDAAFNESFADTVEQIGVERFFADRDPAALARWRQLRKAQQEAGRYVDRARRRLRRLYASDLGTAQKRRGKGAIFDWLRVQYRALGLRDGIDYSPAWLAGLNNASLALSATYDAWTGAFRRLLACNGGKLPAFYAAAARLAKRAPKPRRRRLERLAAGHCAAPGNASAQAGPYNRGPTRQEDFRSGG